MIDWRHWHNEPWLIGGLVFLGWLWAVLAGPWRGRLVRAPHPANAGADVPFPRGHAVRFYASLFIFYLAVGSPLVALEVEGKGNVETTREAPKAAAAPHPSPAATPSP